MNSGSSVTVVRTVRATRHDVFATWTQAELITRWAVDEFTGDPRQGGRYRQMTRDQGGEHVVSGEYREFVPDERLVMTWNYQDPDSADQSEAVVTVRLTEPGPGATDVTVVEEPVSEAGVADAEAAWGGALEALRLLLEQNRASRPGVEP